MDMRTWRRDQRRCTLMWRVCSCSLFLLCAAPDCMCRHHVESSVLLFHFMCVCLVVASTLSHLPVPLWAAVSVLIAIVGCVSAGV